MPDELASEIDPTGNNWQSLFTKNRLYLTFIVLGLLFLGVGVFLYKGSDLLAPAKVEVLDAITESKGKTQEIVVEIAGAVETNGVYRLPKESRVEDLLIASGGLSVRADREWVEKYLNRAAKLIDGQKIIIPEVGQEAGEIKVLPITTKTNSVSNSLINVNSGSKKELESLVGIGQVLAQKIIDQRPYSDLEELVTKGILKRSVFEKIKGEITLY